MMIFAYRFITYLFKVSRISDLNVKIVYLSESMCIRCAPALVSVGLLDLEVIYNIKTSVVDLKRFCSDPNSGFYVHSESNLDPNRI